MAILLCVNCKPNKYQDETYGKNMRVHNPCGTNRTKYRCTVCGNTQERREKREKETN